MEDDGLIQSSSNAALNNKFFRFAFKVARDHISEEKLVSYHCALVVRGGAILAFGTNKNKRHSLVKIHKYYDHCGIHSELAACMKALKTYGDISGCSVYVLRILKDGKTIELSKPCEHCTGVLKSYGINKVYYTTSDGGFIRARAKEL